MEKSGQGVKWGSRGKNKSMETVEGKLMEGKGSALQNDGIDPRMSETCGGWTGHLITGGQTYRSLIMYS